ncbi:MAG: NADH-quinone oxidoreductase subunit L [Bacteroidetes bacterium RIFCSPLOWO2_12_FULL_35_15]|nr:MAG: NADH-quinone oxidoreductase subunit L [Bacteroidetes bacterium RIFCSPLOWO2_12_FULL_35_15]
MINLVWLVPLLPVIGFVIIGLFGKQLSKALVGVIGCGSVLGAFAISIGIFLELTGNVEKSITIDLFSWITAGKLSIPFSFLIDPLSSLFLLIVTGIGFLIHVYSVGYMSHDEGFARFFAYLNLFIFFMLLLVLGSNYLIMFVGWEGVGLCSYLLIGFWFKNTAYNNAAKKAFVMNRIGDLGFLLGIILIFVTFGSIGYHDVFMQAKNLASGNPTLTAITLLLFVGAIGKSAQIPLFTWLPDAMAGPTPVSALIHAATMVTAGIYMIARSNILFTLAPFSMEVVAIVGVCTALFAATIGLAQNDIKKVLAYSTVSQLGFMFLALGVGAYTGAVFHVMTHAFFKALLFLGAGSVIHAMSGEQDIRRMGGLKKHIPVTHLTFLIGTLAIVGFPGFSGFFSKDEILAGAFEHNKLLWFLGVLGAAMTTFYMFRLYFLTFKGSFRGTRDQEHHLHESPKSMTIPLMILAVLSVVGGLVGIPAALGGTHFLEEFLKPVFEDSSFRIIHHLSHETEYILMGVAITVMAIAIYYAYKTYIQNKTLPAEEGEELQPLHNMIYKKYWVDEIYENMITKPLNFISGALHNVVDNQLVDGIVNGVGSLVNRTSSVIRLAQTGNIGLYIFVMVISIVLILLTRIM